MGALHRTGINKLGHMVFLKPWDMHLGSATSSKFLTDQTICDLGPHAIWIRRVLTSSHRAVSMRVRIATSGRCGNDTEALWPRNWCKTQGLLCNRRRLFWNFPDPSINVLKDPGRAASIISKLHQQMGVSIFVDIIKIFWPMTNIGTSNLRYKLIEKGIWLPPDSTLLKNKVVIKINRLFPGFITITIEGKCTRFSLFFFLFSILNSPTNYTLILTGVG